MGIFLYEYDVRFLSRLWTPKKTIAIEAIFSEKPVPYVSICVYVLNMIGKELGLKGGAGGDGR